MKGSGKQESFTLQFKGSLEDIQSINIAANNYFSPFSFPGL